MQEQHGKLHAKADQQSQQPGKVLRWVKASERLPELRKTIFFKYEFPDYPPELLSGQLIDYKNGYKCFVLGGLSYNKFEFIEWLEETEELSAPASLVEEKVEDPMRKHLENIKYMKALYGHVKAYVGCLEVDGGAFLVSDNNGDDKFITELDLKVGTDWQIRRMKFEIIEHLRDMNVGLEFINQFKKWLFEDKFSTNE